MTNQLFIASQIFGEVLRTIHEGGDTVLALHDEEDRAVELATNYAHDLCAKSGEAPHDIVVLEVYWES